VKEDAYERPLFLCAAVIPSSSSGRHETQLLAGNDQHCKLVGTPIGLSKVQPLGVQECGRATMNKR